MPAPTQLLRILQLRLAPRTDAADPRLRFRGTESAASNVLQTFLLFSLSSTPCLVSSKPPASRRSPALTRKTFIISVWTVVAAGVETTPGGHASSNILRRAQPAGPRTLFAETVRVNRHLEYGFARLGRPRWVICCCVDACRAGSPDRTILLRLGVHVGLCRTHRPVHRTPGSARSRSSPANAPAEAGPAAGSRSGS